MKLIWRISAHIVINALLLYFSSQYVSGFHIEPLNFQEVLIAALALTFINFFKPIVKVVLSPIIVVTLGVALIAINGLMLYILDYLLPTVTIVGIEPLVYASLLTAGVNIIARLILR